MNYIDQCLERYEKSNDLGAAAIRSEFLRLQIESANDVPELVRRIKKACDFLKGYVEGDCPTSIRKEFLSLAEELEGPTKEEEHEWTRVRREDAENP